MIHTPVCDLLRIRHPIVLGGMAGSTSVPLVAAVSNAGGLGTLGIARTPAEQIPKDIGAIRETTKAPFGVNFLRFEASEVEVLRFYKIDPDGPDVLTFDCLLTTHPTVAEAWRSRKQVPLEEGSAWVVSIESLIALKRLRGSPMGLLDIEALQTLADPDRDASGRKKDA